ncbi:hypothetical protein [Flavobacterium sp. SM2513]|uniref:hypothetical protein n=1 Tax=Flavobacterium sp. SM2513 TaxID=3424766 RepID=UPI003D7F44A2
MAHQGFEILKDRKKELELSQSFEEILVITDAVSNHIYRLGVLWSYDTALRIGFQKKVYPKNVYLQAGVKKGYKKILDQNSKIRFVEKDLFPQELQVLEPNEIENFLCIWGSNKQKNQFC